MFVDVLMFEICHLNNRTCRDHISCSVLNVHWNVLPSIFSSIVRLLSFIVHFHLVIISFGDANSSVRSGAGVLEQHQASQVGLPRLHQGLRRGHAHGLRTTSEDRLHPVLGGHSQAEGGKSFVGRMRETETNILLVKSSTADYLKS